MLKGLQKSLNIFIQRIKLSLIVYRVEIISLVLIIFGIFLRLLHIGTGSLNPDEAWVAFSVTRPTFSEMLENIMAAPFLFNVVLFYTMKILPYYEVSLRLIPFIFGIICLPLMYLLTYRLTKSKTVALISLIIIAINPWHIHFSRLLKQYTAETFFFMALIILTESLLYTKYRKAEYFLFAILTIISPIFSYPCVFFLILIFPVLLYKFIKDKRKRDVVKIVIPYVISASLFLLIYFVIAKEQAGGSKLINYWTMKGAFPEFSSLSGFLKRFLTKTNDIIITHPFGENSNQIWILIIVGILKLISKNKYKVLYYWVGVLILLFTASIFQKYTYIGNRLTLFTTPLTFIIVGYGIVSIFSLLPKKIYTYLILGFVTFILFIPYIQQLDKQINRQGGGLRESAQFVKQHARPNDNLINYNLYYTHWMTYFEDFSDYLNVIEQPTELHKGSVEFVLEQVNNSRNNTFIVMKLPGRNQQKEFYRRRNELLNCFSENNKIITEYEGINFYAYYISPPV